MFDNSFVRTQAQLIYNNINREVYGGKLPRWGTFNFRVTTGAQRLGAVRSTIDNSAYLRYSQDSKDNGKQPISFSLWSMMSPSYRIKSMTISKMHSDLEGLHDTIRHETAHVAALALDGYSGHGVQWQAHAVKCGAVPSAKSKSKVDVEKAYKYVIDCKGCDTTVARYQRQGNNYKRIASANSRGHYLHGFTCQRCGSAALEAQKKA